MLKFAPRPLTCYTPPQEHADQFCQGRGASQSPVYVFRNALMHLARISRVLSMEQVRLCVTPAVCRTA